MNDKLTKLGFALFTFVLLWSYGLIANWMIYGHGIADTMMFEWTAAMLAVPAAIFTAAMWLFPLWKLFGIGSDEL